jgi:hypothetical protein
LDEINWQSVKTFAFLAILYTVWFIVSGGMSSTMGWMTYLVAWGALCYSALGSGMLADVLQQQGQKYVSASEANVILSTKPVFAALCAMLLLEEVTTLPGTLKSIGCTKILNREPCAHASKRRTILCDEIIINSTWQHKMKNIYYY